MTIQLKDISIAGTIKSRRGENGKLAHKIATRKTVMIHPDQRTMTFYTGYAVVREIVTECNLGRQYPKKTY